MSDAPADPAPPLPWREQSDGCWEARGKLRWTIERGPAGFRLAIDTTHGPDWLRPTLEEARQIAEEVEASGGFQKDLEGWRPWYWPCIQPEGDEIRPLEDQPALPEGATPCPVCGTAEPPLVVKPVSYSFAWWDAPEAYWRCSKCESSRMDLERAEREFTEDFFRENPDLLE